jgi:hypothetical protein
MMDPQSRGLLQLNPSGFFLQEYDPALAQQTLQKSYANSDAAIVAKKRSLLAELVRWRWGFAFSFSSG